MYTALAPKEIYKVRPHTSNAPHSVGRNTYYKALGTGHDIPQQHDTWYWRRNHQEIMRVYSHVVTTCTEYEQERS